MHLREVCIYVLKSFNFIAAANSQAKKLKQAQLTVFYEQFVSRMSRFLVE